MFFKKIKILVLLLFFSKPLSVWARCDGEIVLMNPAPPVCEKDLKNLEPNLKKYLQTLVAYINKKPEGKKASDNEIIEFYNKKQGRLEAVKFINLTNRDIERFSNYLPPSVKCDKALPLWNKIYKRLNKEVQEDKNHCSEDLLWLGKNLYFHLYCSRENCYLDLNEELGSGGYKTVKKGLGIGKRAIEIQKVALLFPNGINKKDKKISIKSIQKEYNIGKKIEKNINEKPNLKNIARIKDYCTSGDEKKKYFAIMDEYEGGSADNIILKGDNWGIQTKRLIQTVRDFHSFLINRDIKPGNILIDKDGNFSISDISLSSSLKKVLKSKTLVGTPAYAPPECFLNVLSGRNTYSDLEQAKKHDIFSLGLSFYKLLYGNESPIAITLANWYQEDANMDKKKDAYINQINKLYEEYEEITEKISDPTEKMKNEIILKMINPDVNKRSSLEKILEKFYN